MLLMFDGTYAITLKVDENAEHEIGNVISIRSTIK